MHTLGAFKTPACEDFFNLISSRDLFWAAEIRRATSTLAVLEENRRVFSEKTPLAVSWDF